MSALGQKQDMYDMTIWGLLYTQKGTCAVAKPLSALGNSGHCREQLFSAMSAIAQSRHERCTAHVPFWV